MPAVRLAAVLLAVVALPAVATAQTDPSPPPPCAPGQEPTAEEPCVALQPAGGLIDPCAEIGSSPDDPCQPIGGTPGLPGGNGGTGGTGGGSIIIEPASAPAAGPPQFRPGFLSRVWRMDADADSYDADANVLNVTITKLLNLPKRFADQDDPFVDTDAYVLFSATTKVYAADGRRVSRERRYDGLLDDADTVRIVGKVLPPGKWQEDQDGQPTPTLRAKRVAITG